METLLRKIELESTDSKAKLIVGNLPLTNNYIAIREYERFEEVGLLLTTNDDEKLIQVDLTKANDCQLISFDKNRNFITKRYYKNHNNAPFSFQLKGFYLLILFKKQEFSIQPSHKLELLDYPSIPGIRHVFGTDEEKVEILASNPHRFYISIHGVWIFPDKMRIEELDKIYEKAKSEGKIALCDRIIKVKNDLLTIYK